MSGAELSADANVESLEGIGSGYAEQLREADVETVDDLAAADADSLADEVDASADQVGDWIDRATDAVEADSDDGSDDDDDDDGSSQDTHDETADPLAIRRSVDTTAEDLIGRPLDGVVEVARTDEGWRASVEIIERRAVPDSQDILGLYEVTLDGSGDIRGYRRVRRYRRSDTSDLE